MARLALSRIAQSLLLLLLVSVVAFALLQLAPGDPGALLYGSNSSAKDMAQVRDRWGLDAPPYLQYLRWLSNTATGDLGRSYVDGRPVLSVIAERIPTTLELAVSALLIATIVGVALGLLSARTKSAWLDRLIRLLTTTVYSTPPFWLGILAILVFSMQLGWLPSGGSRNPAIDGGIWDSLRHLVLPALVLAAGNAARFARVTRASVLTAAAQDYVRTAQAKGLSRTTIELRHVLRNAVSPIFALLGISIPGLLSGTVIVETVFAWPGMGRLVIEAALQRNYPIIMGEVLIIAAMAMGGSLLADLASAAADPRIRRGDRG